MHSRWSSKNEIAADEITAFAAGAGPPENTNPTRLMWSPLRLMGGEPYRTIGAKACRAHASLTDLRNVPRRLRHRVQRRRGCRTRRSSGRGHGRAAPAPDRERRERCAPPVATVIADDG